VKNIEPQILTRQTCQVCNGQKVVPNVHFNPWYERFQEWEKLQGNLLSRMRDPLRYFHERIEACPDGMTEEVACGECDGFGERTKWITLTELAQLLDKAGKQ
jgi:hypothetical protein